MAAITERGALIGSSDPDDSTNVDFDGDKIKSFIDKRKKLLVSARITKRSASVGGEITRGGQKIKEELGKALSDFEKSTKESRL